MKERKSKHRTISCFMAFLGAVLVLRLAFMTLIEKEKWSSYADDMSMRAVYETGPRGDIKDRNGKLIATCRPVYSVNISKVDITGEKAMDSAVKAVSLLEDMGEDIDTTMDEIRALMEDRSYMSYMPVTVAKDISASSAAKIRDSGLPGVYISKDHVREYPYGDIASHVVGYLGRISEDEKSAYVEEKGYRVDSFVGKSGIEKLCEQQLKGTDAVCRLQVDSGGNVTGIIDRKGTAKGEDVTLTLDVELQKTTEEALENAIKAASEGGVFTGVYGDVGMTYAPKTASGAAVAVKIDTGEVLAMASYPDFDPNDFVGGISEEKWAELQQENPNDPLSPSPMYNIATMSAVQPGSTFKPVTALAALSCGLDKQRSLYDAGRVQVGGRSFGCHLWNSSGATHGYVDLHDAMKVSCNYYFYDIASGMDLASNTSLGYEKPMSNETIPSFAKGLGLGESTGIEIEESTGIRPSEEVKKRGVKASLKAYLMRECETYFDEEMLRDFKNLEKKTEKIANQADKDLTLNQLIGKLKKEDHVKKDMITELAEVCKYSYFDQMDWSAGDVFNIAIGQGDNAYTPLQMARYMAALGNGGACIDVSLVIDEPDGEEMKRIEEPDDGDVKPEISAGDIDTVIDALKAVTTESGGSLYGIFKDFPYETAAKTGTAQRAGKINTVDEKDYIIRHLHLIAPDVSLYAAEKEAARLMKAYPEIYDTEVSALRKAVMNLSSRDITEEDIDRFKDDYDNFGWTVALAPADDPKIAVAVLLVQGKTAANAAPVAREIIGKYGEISQWEKLF